MVVLVCGSRGWKDEQKIRDRLDALKPTLVIQGGAAGADLMAYNWAEDNGVPVTTYSPDYFKYGRVAPHKRNDEMLDRKPDCVLVFWDGKSPGTKSMIGKAHRKNLPIEVHRES